MERCARGERARQKGRNRMINRYDRIDLRSEPFAILLLGKTGIGEITSIFVRARGQGNNRILEKRWFETGPSSCETISTCPCLAFPPPRYSFANLSRKMAGNDSEFQYLHLPRYGIRAWYLWESSFREWKGILFLVNFNNPSSSRKRDTIHRKNNENVIFFSKIPRITFQKSRDRASKGSPINEDAFLPALPSKKKRERKEEEKTSPLP